MRPYQQPPRSRLRRPKEKPFAGGTPLQHAAHDSGGTLIHAPLPSREKFQAELDRHAPGCGTMTPVPGTGGTMPCGGMFYGKPHLCPHCQAGKVVDSLLGEETRSQRLTRTAFKRIETNAQERHQAALDRIRGLYGHAKNKPDERQAAVLRRLWKANNYQRFTDYCRKNGLDPNSVVAGS